MALGRLLLSVLWVFSLDLSLTSITGFKEPWQLTLLQVVSKTAPRNCVESVFKPHLRDQICTGFMWHRRFLIIFQKRYLFSLKTYIKRMNAWRVALICYWYSTLMGESVCFWTFSKNILPNYHSQPIMYVWYLILVESEIFCVYSI